MKKIAAYFDSYANPVFMGRHRMAGKLLDGKNVDVHAFLHLHPVQDVTKKEKDVVEAITNYPGRFIFEDDRIKCVETDAAQQRQIDSYASVKEAEKLWAGKRRSKSSKISSSLLPRQQH